MCENELCKGVMYVIVWVYTKAHVVSSVVSEFHTKVFSCRLSGSDIYIYIYSPSEAKEIILNGLLT